MIAMTLIVFIVLSLLASAASFTPQSRRIQAATNTISHRRPRGASSFSTPNYYAAGVSSNFVLNAIKEATFGMG
jgi:hypothetical protein